MSPQKTEMITSVVVHLDDDTTRAIDAIRARDPLKYPTRADVVRRIVQQEIRFREILREK